eukprot:scaffold2159_cov170-Pinguiococcus_pyrenoidosus.AAC.2
MDLRHFHLRDLNGPVSHLAMSTRPSNDENYAFVTVSEGNQGTMVMFYQWKSCLSRAPEHIHQLTLQGAVVTCLAVSPDGRTILIGQRDGTTTVWDGVEHNDCPTHNGEVLSLLAVDDERFVSGGTDNTAKVWARNPTNGSPHNVHTFEHGGQVGSLAIIRRAEASILVTGWSRGITGGGISLFSLDDYEHVSDVIQDAPVRSVIASPNSNQLAVVLPDGLRLLNMTQNFSLEENHQLYVAGAVRSLQYAPDGRHIVVRHGEDSISIHNPLNAGEWIYTWHIQVPNAANEMRSIAFGKSSQWLVTPALQGVRVFDLQHWCGLDLEEPTPPEPEPSFEDPSLPDYEFTTGLREVVEQSASIFSYRYYLVDNSKAMLEGGGVVVSNGQFCPVSRWRDLSETLRKHAALLNKMNLPAEIRFVNASAGFDTTAIQIGNRAANRQESIQRLDRCLSGTPTGRNLLVTWLGQIADDVEERVGQNQGESGVFTGLVILTGDKPADGGRNELEDAVRTLEQKGVTIVIRLCTNDSKVQGGSGQWLVTSMLYVLLIFVLLKGFYRSIRGSSIHTLSNDQDEARRVTRHHPWLSYKSSLHFAREFSLCYNPLLAKLGTAMIPKEDLCDFLLCVFGGDGIPLLSDDNQDEYIRSIETANTNAQEVFDPLQGRESPWIDVGKLRKKYFGWLA